MHKPGQTQKVTAAGSSLYAAGPIRAKFFCYRHKITRNWIAMAVARLNAVIGGVLTRRKPRTVRLLALGRGASMMRGLPQHR